MNYDNYPEDPEPTIKPQGHSKVLQTLLVTLTKYLIARAIIKGWLPGDFADTAIAHQIAEVIMTYTAPFGIILAMYFRRFKSGSRLY